MSDLISNYCIAKNASIICYEIKYSTKSERQKICDFYSDKIDIEYKEAMKNDDYCFFSYSDPNTAIAVAEMNFPTYREIVGETNDSSLYIFCSVYNNKGEFLWDNYLV